MEPSACVVFRSELAKAATTEQRAFAALTCERMMPALASFSNQVGFDASFFRACLDLGWSSLGGHKTNEGLEAMAKECLDRVPDTEEFSSELTSAALNTALSIWSLVQFMSDENVEHILSISDFAVETIAMKIRDSGSIIPASLQEIERHPLFLQEIERQRQDLVFIHGLRSTPQLEAIRQIRERSLLQ